MLKKWALLAAFSVLCTALPVTPGTAAVASATDGVAVYSIVRVLEELSARIARDRLSAPRSSRLYAATALGLLAGWSSARGETLAGIADGFLPPVPATEVDPTLAAIAAAATVERSLFGLTADRSTFASARDGALAALTLEADPAFAKGSVSHGIDVGEAVVKYVATDGTADLKSVKPPVASKPGEWVPTPPNFQPPIEPGWGTLRTFRSASVDCVLPAPPTDGTSESPYEAQANEVADIAKSLTDEQEAIARFWDDGRGRTGTPSGHWFVLALEVGREAGLDAEALVHLIADTSMVMADAFIVVWREKYKWMVERPITVLQRSDATWASYLVTPAFPEYPSGHSAISRAAADVLTSHLGERSFTDPGWGMTGPSRADFEITPRTFDSFSAAAAEASASRLYAGIHFPMGVEAGSRLGACIGKGFAAR